MAATASTADLRFLPDVQQMQVGEKRRLMVMLKTDAPLNLAVTTLRFDNRVLAVRSVIAGNLFASNNGSAVAPLLSHSTDKEGNLLVSIESANGATWASGAGVLLMIDVEAMAAGESSLQFNADSLHLVAPDGRVILKRTQAGRVIVK